MKFLSCFLFLLGVVVSAVNGATAHNYTLDGCYSRHSNLAIDQVQLLPNATSSGCISACGNFPFFALNYDICVCQATAPPARPIPCDNTTVPVYKNLDYVPPVIYANSTIPYVGCFPYHNSSDFAYQTIRSWYGMTANDCVSTCLSRGMASYFGVTKDKCLCANRPPTTNELPPSSCKSPCGRNITQVCGGTDAISVYGRASGPAFTADKKYTVQGCYPDAPLNPLLTEASFTTTNMTVDRCEDLCHGYATFGVESGQQCYCSSGESWRGKAVSSEFCTTPCAGNISQACGGYHHLNIYTAPAFRRKNPAVIDGYNFLGCWDSTIIKPETGTAWVKSNYMTLEQCRSVCDGAQYFGVSGELCNCGDSITGGPVLIAKCDIACPGNGTEWCGGDKLKSLYRKAPLPP